MHFYNTHILPHMLNMAMNSKATNKHRPEVVSNASGVVLEIGFGSGLNLPYYKNVAKLYALEPSETLYHLAEKRIKSAQFPVEYLKNSAEKIPLEDNSVDSVVSTWTLCSIPHPEQAIKEIQRVLKPSGTLSFIEHGKSPKLLIAKLQKYITPLSKKIAGGCHMDRDIMQLMGDDFTLKHKEQFQERFTPLLFMYKGVAVIHK